MGYKVKLINNWNESFVKELISNGEMDLSIAYSHELLNHDFENDDGVDFDNWTSVISGSSSISILDNGGSGNSQCPQLSRVGLSNCYLTQSALTVNKLYALSFQARKISGSDPDPELFIKFGTNQTEISLTDDWTEHNSPILQCMGNSTFSIGVNSDDTAVRIDYLYLIEVTNDFIADDWVLNSGNCGYYGNIQYVSNSAGNDGQIYQYVYGQTNGRKYTLTFDAKSIVGTGRFVEYESGLFDDIIINNTEFQTFTTSFTLGTAPILPVFQADSNATENTNHIAFKNVSLKELPNEDITPSDLEVFGKIKIDPQKLIGEDFFVHTPRKVKITFVNHEFLHNFLEPEGSTQLVYTDEISYILYLNSDGEILESSNPNLFIGDTIGYSSNNVIDSKEVIIKQISKVILLILDDNDEIIFTGLIDKTKTKYDIDTISIIAYDFMYLIKILGEQLIKVVSGVSTDEYFDYIFSQTTINEFIEKIQDITGLSISSNLDFNHGAVEVTPLLQIERNLNDFVEDCYEASGTASYEMIEDMQTSSSWKWHFSGDGDEIYLYRIYINVALIKVYNDGVWVSWSINKCGAIEYTKYSFETGILSVGSTEEYVNQISVGGTSTYNVGQTRWENLYPTGIIDIMEELTKEINDDFIEDISATKNKSVENFVYYLDSADTDDEYVNFKVFKIQEDYYKNLIPINTDTYKYLDLFKTILYLNMKMFSVSGDGEISVLDKNIYDSTAPTIDISDEDLLFEFNVSGKEKKEYISEALTKVYYDFETDGIKYVFTDPGTGKTEFLDTYMKRQYKELFNLFPLFLTCKIKNNYTLEVGSTIGINHSILPSYMCGIWIISECILDEDRFTYKIKAMKYNGD